MSIASMDKVLIASITPYFLEKGNVWFEENLDEILSARKTQSFFEDNVIYLEKDQTANLSETLRKLDEMGYEKVLTAQEPGDFSQRGGVIDVFPINLNHAVRLEFLGNKIDTIQKMEIGINDESKSKEILKKKLKSQKLFADLKGLKPGDYLVHLDHGIGRYVGNEKIQIWHEKQQTKENFSHSHEYYVLEYASNDKLFIPIGLERKLSRYVGFVDPKISRLGSPAWQKTKRRVKEETEKIAKEILEVAAARQTTMRPAYLAADEIDKMIANGFPYEETADQQQALEEISKDLESQKPMDRLICGDVGFGKTEIALRTAAKAANSGYQTVLIAPTTILASQHYQNFKERIKDLPIKLSLLSRLQSKKDQKEIAENLKAGNIDILIGTHRIFSNDILPFLFEKSTGKGLLIIDDEQRFGVKQKEKIKQLRSSLDVLSLSATPIPRTLYMALSSLKEVSIIQTPPHGRIAVKTSITPFDKNMIQKAINQEMQRNGQIYYLHNRVETIGKAKRFIEKLKLSKKPTVEIVHGQMHEKQLIKAMQDFQQRRIDILIATTIIENGLDNQNANTMIVADASRLGLSQAYQIKGRVGRSHIQAYAYFFHGKNLSENAEKRLKALKEAEELGSGYKIALRDLEIRGSGNILGKEQSGNINQVGLNLYCQILSEAVEKQKALSDR